MQEDVLSFQGRVCFEVGLDNFPYLEGIQPLELSEIVESNAVKC